MAATVAEVYTARSIAPPALNAEAACPFLGPDPAHPDEDPELVQERRSELGPERAADPRPVEARSVRRRSARAGAERIVGDDRLAHRRALPPDPRRAGRLGALHRR